MHFPSMILTSPRAPDFNCLDIQKWMIRKVTLVWMSKLYPSWSHIRDKTFEMTVTISYKIVLFTVDWMGYIKVTDVLFIRKLSKETRKSHVLCTVTRLLVTTQYFELKEFKTRFNAGLLTQRCIILCKKQQYILLLLTQNWLRIIAARANIRTYTA